MNDVVTHAWLRRVSNYHSGGVSAAERAAVEAHLAECADCRQALGVYRRFLALASSPLRLGEEGEGALPEYRTVTQEETMITSDSDRSTRSTTTRPRGPRTAATALGAVAAVVLIAILASVLFALHRAPSGPATPHPTRAAALDAQTQAYVGILHAYYPGFAQAALRDAGQCMQPASVTQAVLQSCRPLEVAALTAAQTLLAHLQSTPPPARWRAADSQLKQAIRAEITYYTERIKAIDTHDANLFLNPQPPIIEGAVLTCSAFKRFDIDLQAAGVAPESLQDLQPLDPDICVGTSPAPEGAGT